MVDCGTTTITDPEEYRALLPRASIDLVLTGPGDFKVQLTWVTLGALTLVRIEEKVPRIGFLRLAPGVLCLTFPIRTQLPTLWGGVEVQPCEMAMHSLGDHFHQRTFGSCHWGLISIRPKHLATYSRALAHLTLSPPPDTAILRPFPTFEAGLRRLHRQACRLAETKPDTVAHKKVAQAIEQHVLHELVNCLVAPTLRPHERGRQRRAEIMRRFENVLEANCHRHVSITEICEAVGVEERMLRMYCAQSLRLSPMSYQRLRRLNLVRAVLRGAEPSSVSEIARSYGFSELGRFAVEYRVAFGETPSATLRGRRKIRDVN
jgi:AraC-like DNA-binding protein